MFNVEEQTEKVIDWTRNWMNEKGEDSKAIIGISGGIDSSTVAAILEMLLFMVTYMQLIPFLLEQKKIKL